MYAILRVKKLKKHNIGGVAAHTERSRETKNANPNIKNVVLVGSNCKKNIEEKLPQKYRKDAVVAVETVCTASPSFFKEKSKEEIEEWAKDTVSFLQKFWKNNVVYATLHLDETTPHIHAYSVPLVEGKLACKQYIGDRQKLSNLQTLYAKEMEKWGLQRGIKGSKAKHIKLKKYYSLLNRELKKIKKIKIDIPPIFGKEKWAKQKQEEIEKLYKSLAPIVAKAKVAEVAKKREKEIRETIYPKVEELQEKIESFKAEWNSCLQEIKEVAKEIMLEKEKEVEEINKKYREIKSLGEEIKSRLEMLYFQSEEEDLEEIFRPGF